MKRHLLFSLVLVWGLSARGQGAAPKTLIVAIGDSTTAGTPFFKSPVESPPDGYGDPEGQYTYWMMRRRPSWEVRNHGVAGETSALVRGRLIEALKDRPRFVIILAGVNDLHNGVEIGRVMENLISMYTMAKGYNVMPIAATVLPYDQATPAQAKAVDKLNARIKKAADRLNIPLADLNAALRDPKNPHKLTGSPDGIHPDLGGYRKMGMVLVDTIDPIDKVWR